MPKIKNLDDLRQIRDTTKKEMKSRESSDTIITVGMGTCGIAAGAREVMNAIVEEVNKLDDRDVEVNSADCNVVTTGCIGMCSYEPIVEIKQPGSERIIYGDITPEKVPQLISQHLVQGTVIRDWVIATAPEEE